MIQIGDVRVVSACSLTLVCVVSFQTEKRDAGGGDAAYSVSDVALSSLFSSELEL
jgi:hypothetical protein